MELNKIHEDISFIIQGLINQKITKECLNNIRKYFPKSEIILSTYKGENIDGLLYDKVVLTEDNFEAHPYLDKPGAKINNINKQIASTLAGLKEATKKYSFKIRTDFILSGDNFLKYFDKFIKYDENYKVFKHKVLCPISFSRNPRVKKLPFAFHPSDIAFFGLTEDLINLFDIPLMPKDEFFAWRNHNNIISNKYVPEQYLWINCLRKNGKTINCDYQIHINEELITETEKYFVSNFIFLDWNQFSLTKPKKLNNYYKNEYSSIITHIEYKKLYKEYIDSSIKTELIDLKRIKINIQTIKVKIFKQTARIMLLPFFGKRLKEFRRKSRERIINALVYLF